MVSTGDVGELDGRGNLRITDRKKEIIVTSGGKNIAPQKVENLMKSIRFVNHAMVYGDKRQYLVALMTPNEAEISAWAMDRGIDFDSIDDLLSDHRVLQMLEKEVARVNNRLSSYETIKRFRVLPRDFTIEAGELTPSLKVKRKVVTERHRELFDQMYA